MLDWLLIILVFFVMLSVLVAAHELGHYLFARLFNMGVEEFAIGFGRPVLWTWGKRTYTLPMKPGEMAEAPPESPLSEPDAGTKMAVALEGGTGQRQIPSEVIETSSGKALRETTAFTFRAWPLGGFVRIKGMLPHEDGSETRVAGGFYSKAPWQRFIVLLAGPVFSVIAGMIIFIGLVTIHGGVESTGRPIVEKIEQGSPAEKAGLKVGDQIVAIEGKPIQKHHQAILAVRDQPGKTLAVQVSREGQTTDLQITPLLAKEASPVIDAEGEFTKEVRRQARIGVVFESRRVRMPLGEATVAAMKLPVVATVGIVQTLISPKKFKENMGGPITIVNETARAVRFGPWDVVRLAGLLSISVGILNLLPIPPLDGGQMVIAVAEMFRGGRRLSFKVQNVVAAIGALMVFTLLIAVMAVDVGKFFVNR